jgi:hypothetical protein
MISLPTFHKPPPPDNCGPCTACCIIPAVPEFGKPFYARCEHLAPAPAQGCGIYNERPDRCAKYRCAWHLNVMGNRTDRRPDQSGVLFQYEPGDDGKWYLGMYELTPGAAKTEKARFLRDMVLSSKQMAHLPMGTPAVRVFPYGADLKTDFDVSPKFGQEGSGSELIFKMEGNAMVYNGPCREILDPEKAPR